MNRLNFKYFCKSVLLGTLVVFLNGCHKIEVQETINTDGTSEILVTFENRQDLENNGSPLEVSLDYCRYKELMAEAVPYRLETCKIPAPGSAIFTFKKFGTDAFTHNSNGTITYKIQAVSDFRAAINDQEASLALNQNLTTPPLPQLDSSALGLETEFVLKTPWPILKHSDGKLIDLYTLGFNQLPVTAPTVTFADNGESLKSISLTTKSQISRLVESLKQKLDTSLAPVERKIAYVMHLSKKIQQLATVRPKQQIPLGYLESQLIELRLGLRPSLPANTNSSTALLTKELKSIIQAESQKALITSTLTAPSSDKKIVAEPKALIQASPKKNSQPCDRSLTTKISDKELACFGLHDYGSTFGGDSYRCESEFYMPATGCTISTNVCRSGYAQAMTYYSNNDLKLSGASTLGPLSRRLNTNPENLKKDLDGLWEYYCVPESEVNKTLVMVDLEGDGQLDPSRDKPSHTTTKNEDITKCDRLVSEPLQNGYAACYGIRDSKNMFGGNRYMCEKKVMDVYGECIIATDICQSGYARTRKEINNHDFEVRYSLTVASIAEGLNTTSSDLYQHLESLWGYTCTSGSKIEPGEAMIDHTGDGALAPAAHAPLYQPRVSQSLSDGELMGQVRNAATTLKFSHGFGGKKSYALKSHTLQERLIDGGGLVVNPGSMWYGYSDDGKEFFMFSCLSNQKATLDGPGVASIWELKDELCPIENLEIDGFTTYLVE